MSNLAGDRAGRSSTYERLRTVVAPPDVVADRSNQLADTAEGSSPDTIVGDFREVKFYQIQPGSAGRGEVSVIAGVRSKPGFHRRMGVGAIVVEDQMDRQPAGCGALDALQKAQELLMAMARHAVAQH